MLVQRVLSGKLTLMFAAGREERVKKEETEYLGWFLGK